MYYDVKIDKTTGKTSGIMGFVVKTSGAFNQNKVIGQMAESFPVYIVAILTSSELLK